MRISLRHEITCRFGKPVLAVQRILRITPWAISSQHLDAWRVDLDCDCRLRSGDDAFGNIVHTVSAIDAVDGLSIRAEGEIVTTDTAGVLRSQLERFPPAFFLRDTECTAADESLREFATGAATGETLLNKLHSLLVAVCDDMKVISSDKPAPTAIEAYRDREGTARDLAHVFIAAARHIGAPARFVSGCLVPSDYAEMTDASHAWAEAYVAGIGWIGFDPLHGLCTHEGHVRIAIALDHLGALPMRSAAHGATETVTSKLIACEACGIGNRQERSFGMSQAQFQR